MNTKMWKPLCVWLLELEEDVLTVVLNLGYTL